MSKNKTKSRGGVGTFFFGGFVGFISCLALLAGLGCFIYFKVSPNWVNKTFKTDIDLGSDEANNLTLKDVFTNAVGLVQNFDNYKLSSLEKDFGIKLNSDLFGIDITDLKNVELSKLGDAVEKKFSNISAGELKNIPGMNLDNMKGILDKSNTYYYNNEKLFSNSEYSKEVAFEYSLSSDKSSVTIKGKTYSIVSNKIKVALWDLPLTCAFGDFTGSMGDNLTLADLEEDFGVELPSFLNKVDKEHTTVNQLEGAINSLYLADILGYTIDDSDPDNIVVKDSQSQDVTGIMFELAIEKVSNLKDLGSKFGNLTGADLEGSIDLTSLNNILSKTKTYFVNSNKLYSDSAYSNEVSFDYEISGQEVTIGDNSFVINSNKINVVLKDMPLATAISEFTKNLGDTLTLQELKEQYGVVLPSYIYNDNESKTINEIDSIINNLKVANILGYTINGENVKNGEEDVTGIMAIIAKKKVGELNDIQSVIEDQTIATLLNYSVDDSDPDNVVVTDKDGAVITGLLAKIAPFTIKNVNGVVNTLTLSDVFDSTALSSGVFKLLDQSKVATMKIVNISTDFADAVKDATLGELESAGLITADVDVYIDTDLNGSKETLLSDMKLNEFVDVAISILSK